MYIQSLFNSISSIGASHKSGTSLILSLYYNIRATIDDLFNTNIIKLNSILLILNLC